MQRILLMACLLCGLYSLKAQTHEGNNDCTYGKEIIVPFNYAENGAPKPKHHLNQTLFYSYRDQFSFWYKIEVKENATLSFKVKPINDSDEYAVYVYQYNEKDFCDKVYYQKINPVKPSFFTNSISTKDPYDLSEKAFTAKKNNVYYISVLNTSLNNCGHSFYLVNQKDTLKVKALHLPCKRDLGQLDVKKETAATTNKPVVSSETEKPKNQIPPSVKKDTVSNLNVSHLISNKDSTKKDSIHPLTAKLNALKEGDHLVMKSIYFYPNTYALKKASLPELQKLLQYLTDNQNVRIEIQGHTNGDHRIAKNKAYATLGEEWNYEGSAKTLSLKRAEIIKKYLEANGIKPERLEAKGYGGKNPIIKDPQSNEEGQYNIRVELLVLKSKA